VAGPCRGASLRAVAACVDEDGHLHFTAAHPSPPS
jgi:hypothetical protein